MFIALLQWTAGRELVEGEGCGGFVLAMALLQVDQINI